MRALGISEDCLWRRLFIPCLFIVFWFVWGFFLPFYFFNLNLPLRSFYLLLWWYCMRLVTILRIYYSSYFFGDQRVIVEVIHLIIPRKYSSSQKAFEVSFSCLLLSFPVPEVQEKLGAEAHGKMWWWINIYKNRSMCSKQILVSGDCTYFLWIQIVILTCNFTNLYIQWNNCIETESLPRQERIKSCEMDVKLFNPILNLFITIRLAK